SWRMLGAHFVECEGVAGVRFTVWAPSAQVVSVAGDFNGWGSRMHPMRLRNGGIWEVFLPGVERGAAYKNCVRWRNGFQQVKADPYAFAAEKPPKQASLVWGVPQYEWHDQEWLDRRAKTDWLRSPISMYEVHLESWLHGEKGRLLSYRELADRLVTYVKNAG